MVCLVVALEKEAKDFIEENNLTKTAVILGKPLYTGKVCEKEVALIISGMGKVNASISCQAVIDKFSPDYIINFGSAGGVEPSVKIKNYYLIENCAEYDFDVSKLDNVPVGYIQDYDRVLFPNFVRGLDFLEKKNLGTADRFSDSDSDREIIKNLPASICDMEGAGVSHTCFANSVPVVIVKGITDVNGSCSTYELFKQNLDSVVKGFPALIKKVIENLG